MQWRPRLPNVRRGRDVSARAVFLAALAGAVVGCGGGGVAVAVAANLNAFSFLPRPAVSFPVATVRPETPASVAALDVTPSAGAVPNPDNGFAWIDACDADIRDSNGGVPVTCARVGVKADRVEFGSRNFDGGNPKDIYIIRGTQPVARFHAGGLEVYGTITQSP